MLFSKNAYFHLFRICFWGFLIADLSPSTAEYYSEVSVGPLTQTGTQWVSHLILFYCPETWPMPWYGREHKMHKDEVREPKVCLHGHHSDTVIPPIPWAGQTQGMSLPGMNASHGGSWVALGPINTSTQTPQEPLSSLVWETVPKVLLRVLWGVGYMFGGSLKNEDVKMWHVRARNLATLGIFIQGCTHTAEMLPDLCSFSPARSTGLTNTQFPTFIYVHKLSTEVLMKSNHNDIFPW